MNLFRPNKGSDSCATNTSLVPFLDGSYSAYWSDRVGKARTGAGDKAQLVVINWALALGLDFWTYPTTRAALLIGPRARFCRLASFRGWTWPSTGRWYQPDMQGLGWVSAGAGNIGVVLGWSGLPQDLPKPSVGRKKQRIWVACSRFLGLGFLRWAGRQRTPGAS